MNISEVTPKDLFLEDINFMLFRNDVLVVKVKKSIPYRLNYNILPMRLCGYGAYITSKGSMEITVDQRKFKLGENEIIEVFSNNIINMVLFSSDFSGYFILIAEKLYYSIESWTTLDPLNKISDNRFGLVSILNENESGHLLKLLQRIYNAILKDRHCYRTNVIHAEVTIFLLKTGYLQTEKERPEKEVETGNLDKHSHKYIVLHFSRLVLLHCRKESSVSFYASKLFLTPQLLSHIIKTASGSSAKVWINKARISEAITLIRDTSYTIQQISEELAFSDLTGFCRFFRKHMHISPLEYRKKMIKEYLE